MPGRASALALACISLPALAADQVGIKPAFTDAKGRQAVFNVQFPDAPPLVPGRTDATTVAAEFQRICVATGFNAGAVEAAVAQSPLQLTRSKLRYLGDRNTGPFDIDGWHALSVDVRLWTGAPDAFRRLPFYTVDAGAVITGPMRNLPHQCNLEVASSALTDFTDLVTVLTQRFGREPEYQKAGKRWGQAEWRTSSPTGDSAIGLRVDDLDKPAQMLHLGIVQLPRQTDS